MAAINQARPASTTSVRTPLFILGVALALVAFIVMFAFGLLFANKTSTGTMVTVVVAGYIAQGDYIDIIATVNTSLFATGRPQMVNKVVFTNVHVIRIGPSSTLPKQGVPQGLSSSITIVLPLCDATYLDWLSLNATMKYALLNYKDYNKKPEEKPNPACPDPTVAPEVVGPAAVNARWGFLQG